MLGCCGSHPFREAVEKWSPFGAQCAHLQNGNGHNHTQPTEQHEPKPPLSSSGFSACLIPSTLCAMREANMINKNECEGWEVRKGDGEHQGVGEHQGRGGENQGGMTDREDPSCRERRQLNKALGSREGSVGKLTCCQA